MFDSFDREITYLRISVTDRCNLRCRYCMPEEGVQARRPEELLSFDQIVRAAHAAVGIGIRKIRLTGGEPLVRRGVVSLVRRLARIEGLQRLAMTTNGTLLARHARDLRDAGLCSVNVSLDCLDPERYRSLTRGGEVADVQAGISAALASGLPVKINVVVMEDTTEAELEGMRAYCQGIGARIQLIRRFDIVREKRDEDRFDRPPRCARCDRIRLLADGTLKPCLHSDREVRLDFSRLEESLREAVRAKPLRGAACSGRMMSQIGG